MWQSSHIHIQFEATSSFSFFIGKFLVYYVLGCILFSTPKLIK